MNKISAEEAARLIREFEDHWNAERQLKDRVWARLTEHGIEKCDNLYRALERIIVDEALCKLNVTII